MRIRQAQPNCALGGLVAFTSLFCGACMNEPARVAVPTMDSAKAAAEAMKTYDKDSDGSIAGAELVAAPAIQDALSFYDTNSDSKVSVSEMEARLKQMYGTKVGLMTFACRVTLQGQPLAGATVKLQPEPFMNGIVHPASGVTAADGTAQIEVADSLLPADNRGLHAMQPGVYRVEITHPERKIAPKFNTQTTLGIEVAGDSLVGKQIVFVVTEG